MAPMQLDKWELLTQLGSGGMAEVWLARHTVMGRDVAIKIMLEKMARDEREVARFTQEAQIAGKLQHKNVVRVEDVGRTPDGRPYLVMERLKGESLEDRFDKVRMFSPRETLGIMAQAAAALQAAHDAGIVHRDIKPANLFLAQEDGQEILKVLDFGLARVVDPELTSGRRLTALGRTVGTPLYMSPEQATGKSDIDARSDLWALAVITYEMLTGAHPFLDEKGGDVRVSIVRAAFQPPSALNPSLAPSVDAWMARALSREREKRFGNAREWLESLERALTERTDVPRTSRASAPHIITDPGVGRPVGQSSARLSVPPTSVYSADGAVPSVPMMPAAIEPMKKRSGGRAMVAIALAAVAILLVAAMFWLRR